MSPIMVVLANCLLFLTVSCSDHNGAESSVVNKEIASNKPGEVQFYLTPINIDDRDLERTDFGVLPNGNLVFSIKDVLKSNGGFIKTNILYNSSMKNRLQSTLGTWSLNHFGEMDVTPDFDLLKIKSSLYSNSESACVVGWDQISELSYRSLLSSAKSVFNRSTGLCDIVDNNEVVLSLVVYSTKNDFNKSNIHTVTKANGTTYLFTKEKYNRWKSVTADNVGLERVQQGWKFISEKDQIEYYDNKGRLLSLELGSKILEMEYDKQNRLIKIVEPNVDSVELSYSAEGLIAEMTSASTATTLRFSYTDNRQLAAISTPKNGQEEELMYFEYDDNGLLNTMMQGKSAVLTFTYDYLERVVDISDAEVTTNYSYFPTSVILSDGKGSDMSTEYVLKGSIQLPVAQEYKGYKQKGTYDEKGRLVSITGGIPADINHETTRATGPLVKNSNFKMSYNSKGALRTATMEDPETGERKSKTYRYDSSFKKPTGIFDENGITYLAYNKKGLITKRTRIVNIAPYDAKYLEAASPDEVVQLVGVKAKNTKYKYDDNWRLSAVTDEKGGITRFEYNAKGKKIATIRPDGSRIEKENYDQNSVVSRKMNSRAATVAGNYINARSSNTQVVFVGGGGDGAWPNGTTIVQNYESAFESNYASKSQFYSHWDIGTIMGISGNSDPFNKTGDPLIVVGHSWGGDSAVEASKQTDASHDVELLVTIDPVGTADWNDGSQYWIEVYINPPPRWTQVFTGWASCGWFCYYPTWGLIDNWTSGDVTAWMGGKGTYSTYDPGNANPDKLLEYDGHHEWFSTMINNMERDYSQYRFGLTN